ncbi:MAG: UDP-N-acetylglucosamine 2-epimerase, partial [Pseudomonadota bacterium]
RYGLTKLEVARTQGVHLHAYQNQRDGDPQDLIFAKTVMGFSDHLAEHKPDLVVVHGDRIEAIACALTCATNYIRCAHIEGGEVSGTIDEIFRHCNSKLAHAHFVSSNIAKARVMAMGEDENTIHTIGSPELDLHKQPSGVSLDQVKAYYDLPFDDFGIVVFHPVTSEAHTMGDQAAALFGALSQSGQHFVVIHPNNDPGGRAILDVIHGLPQQQFRHLPSMRFTYFSELMRNAAVMVGNSSAGVREAPFLGLPSLDIGTRQTNRALSHSVHLASAYESDKIASFLKDRWGKRTTGDTSFGEGSAAQRFVAVLQNSDFWTQSLQKKFVDG